MGLSTSPTCRAQLGDRDCRVALAPLTLRGQATAVAGAWVSFSAPLAADRYRLGRLRWLDGVAAGLDSVIADQDGARLLLAEMPPGLPALPTRVELRAGCDKRLDTCVSRFANAANFRGKAHLPGLDLLLRYPGG